MFSHLRTFLVAVLVAFLVASPLMGAPARALGNVVYAERARLGAAQAQNGATIFPGDQFVTEKDGSLRLRLGDGQLYLLASSAASVAEINGLLGADLERGTVGFSSTPASPLVVRSGALLVRAKAKQATHGRVQRLNAKEFVVSSYRGPLEVSVDGEVYVVSEATSYRVSLDSEIAQEQGRENPAGVGAAAARHHQVMMTLLGAAISATIITFVILQNLSPEIP